MNVFVDGFRAMGTDVEVTVVDADPTLLEVASRRIAELEQRWSRFISSSEVSRLNRACGRTTRVSADTFALVAHAQEGFDLTGGRFDACQLNALVRLGYVESFENLPRANGGAIGRSVLAPVRVDRAARIEVDADNSTVRLPEGVQFDSGGIGKGFAADLVVEELGTLGAAGVCVNVGGDVRVSGVAPNGQAWVVAVRDRAGDLPVAHVALSEGAVATTSRSRRRWRGPDGQVHHHIVDPATGSSAVTPVVHAAAVASEGWRAEILAKVAFLERVEGIALAERIGATAMVATDAGIVTGPRWAEFECGTFSERAGLL
ncbi:MAG: FAD:protein FMN transferase [Acidimicrobiia bacterium]